MAHDLVATRIADELAVPAPVAARYREALEDFLGAAGLSSYSPHTRAAYERALREFHGWQRLTQERVLPPHEVRRSHAAAYLEWMAAPTFRLAQLRPLEDPRAAVAHEVLAEAVAELGFAEVYRRAADRARVTELDLHSGLTRLSRAGVVARRPTVRQFCRVRQIQVVKRWDMEVDGRPAHDHFSYRIKPIAPHSPQTVAQRLAALSRWWRVLARGENAPGGAPLLIHDIWEGYGARIQRRVAAHRALASEAQRIAPETIARVVEHCLEPPADASPVRLRDQALLLLLSLSGLRVSEALTLERRGLPTDPRADRLGWLEHPEDTGRPAHMVVTRKGGKKVRLAVPAPAYEAWRAMQACLRSLGGADYQLTVDDEAPAFPSLRRWGITTACEHRHLSRRSIDPILRGLAEDAGVAEDEAARIHPHALRHFFALANVEAGVPLRDVQAMLSHASVTTTEGYLPHPDSVEHRDLSASILSSVGKWRGKPPDPARRVMVLDVEAEDG